MRALTLAAIVLGAAAVVCAPIAAPSPSPAATASGSTIASPTLRLPTASPSIRGASFYFEPGPVLWCGVFGAAASSELKIGSAVFSGSSSPPFIGSDVRPGGWVCLSGTIVRSEISTNQLADVSVATAPLGTMPSGIRASPCGLITELFVGDLPSGGFITLNGTKFLVGGARPAGDQVALPPGLRTGLSLCITGTRLEPSAAGSFTAIGGRAVVMP